MSAPAIQLSFSLRTSSSVKTVHLLGSWDGYKGQLPLSKDPAHKGAWRGTFRFPGSVVKQGQRYWYYYIVDGYHASHDPSRPSVTEPTTGRDLNVLNVPPASTPASKYLPPINTASYKTSRHDAKAAVKGRPISPSRIVSPRPVNPIATRKLTTTDYTLKARADSLERKLAAARIDSDSDPGSTSSSDDRRGIADSSSELDESDSDSGRDSGRRSVPSLTSGSSTGNSERSSPCNSPTSPGSDVWSCRCERFGITRKGERIRLDCGGSRCGPSEGGSCGGSESDDGSTKRVVGLPVRKKVLTETRVEVRRREAEVPVRRQPTAVVSAAKVSRRR